MKPTIPFFIAAGLLAAPMPADTPPVFAPRDLTPLVADGMTVAKAAAPDGADALVFDGTSAKGAAPALGDRAAKMSGEEVSASFWFRMDAPSEADVAFGFKTVKPPYDFAPVRLNLKTNPTDFGVFEAWSHIEHRVAPGEWHHLAYVFSLSNLAYSVYFDGQEQMAAKSIDADLPSPIDLKSLFAPFGAKGFKGAVASPRVWNRALTRDELLQFAPAKAAATALAAKYAAQKQAGNAKFGAACSALADKIAALADKPADIRDWQAYARIARDLPALAKLADAANGTGDKFVASTFYPYSAEKRLPFVLPADAAPAAKLRLILAQGEFESATFMLHPLGDVRDLAVEARPPVSGNGAELPRDALDIRLVKCWYTPFGVWNSYFHVGSEFNTLASEILLHDDSLIVADKAKRRNFLRVDYKNGSRYVDISKPGVQSKTTPFNYVNSPVADTKGPMPANVSLAFGENKQFWITVHAPAEAAPGLYRTSIAFAADGAPAGSIPLEVEILPFKLPRAATRYDLGREYIGGMMNHCGLSIQLEMGHSLVLAEKRFSAEMRNMAEHNILHPFVASFSQTDPVADKLAEREYRLLGNAGGDLGFMFGGGAAFEQDWIGEITCGGDPAKNNTPEKLERCKAKYEKTVQHVAKRYDEVLGHRNATFYGWDEAGPATVREEFPFFSILGKYGFKSFITSGVAPYANFAVDCNDFAASIRGSVAAEWHDANALMFSYAAPFTGPKNPETWRRNKGMRMYVANYDGIAEYVWYEGFDIWNDNILPGRYKNFNIVYPTADGVLDTVAWEGMREGFDDIRYATLLRMRCENAMKSADKAIAQSARESLFWLDTCDPETMDLDAFRAEMAARIAQFPAAPAETAPKAKTIAPPPPAAGMFVAELPEPASFDALVDEAAKLKSRHMCDLALPLLERAVAMPDVEEGKLRDAQFELADIRRLLLDDESAAQVFRGIVADPRASADVKAKAYLGLMRTIVAPSEFDWSPTPAALDAAEKLYGEALGERRFATKARADLLCALADGMLRGGRAARFVQLCDDFLAFGTPKQLKGPVTYPVLERRGDALVKLGEYARAVKSYDSIDDAGYNRMKILEKTGDSARLAKNFRRAQQAYADMIPMIDKEEGKDLYNRISRIVVSLTKATRKSTKTDAAASLDLEAESDFGDLSLDE